MPPNVPLPRSLATSSQPGSAAVLATSLHPALSLPEPVFHSDEGLLHLRPELSLDGQRKTKSAFERIFEKYGKAFDQDDEIDLDTGEVVVDKGQLRTRLPDVANSAWTASEYAPVPQGHNEDSEDELAPFDNCSSGDDEAHNHQSTSAATNGLDPATSLMLGNALAPDPAAPNAVLAPSWNATLSSNALQATLDLQNPQALQQFILQNITMGIKLGFESLRTSILSSLPSTPVAAPTRSTHAPSSGRRLSSRHMVGDTPSGHQMMRAFRDHARGKSSGNALRSSPPKTARLPGSPFDNQASEPNEVSAGSWKNDETREPENENDLNAPNSSVSKRNTFTAEDDALLIKLKLQGASWRDICSHFPQHTTMSVVRNRWYKVLQYRAEAQAPGSSGESTLEEKEVHQIPQNLAPQEQPQALLAPAQTLQRSPELPEIEGSGEPQQADRRTESSPALEAVWSEPRRHRLVEVTIISRPAGKQQQTQEMPMVATAQRKASDESPLQEPMFEETQVREASSSEQNQNRAHEAVDREDPDQRQMTVGVTTCTVVRERTVEETPQYFRSPEIDFDELTRQTTASQAPVEQQATLPDAGPQGPDLLDQVPHVRWHSCNPRTQAAKGNERNTVVILHSTPGQGEDGVNDAEERASVSIRIKRSPTNEFETSTRLEDIPFVSPTEKRNGVDSPDPLSPSRQSPAPNPSDSLPTPRNTLTPSLSSKRRRELSVERRLSWTARKQIRLENSKAARRLLVRRDLGSSDDELAP